MSNDAPEAGSEAPSFEAALGRLEKAVQALESGDLGLDDALAQYEEGVRLVARCRSLLEKAERAVALLTGVDEQGEPTTAPFDATATVQENEPPDRPAGRAKRSGSTPRGLDSPS